MNKTRKNIGNALTETVKNRIGRPLLPLFSVQGDCRAETVNDFLAGSRNGHVIRRRSTDVVAERAGPNGLLMVGWLKEALIERNGPDPQKDSLK